MPVKKLIQLCLISSLLFSACYKNAIASFDATSDTRRLEAEAKIFFNNTSTLNKSFFWDFGDGATSTDRNPDHIYEKPGNYSVILVAHSKDGGKGKSKSISKTIEVLDKIKISGSIGGIAFDYKTGDRSESYDVTTDNTEVDSSDGTYAYRKFVSGLLSDRSAYTKGIVIMLGCLKHIERNPTQDAFNAFFKTKHYNFSNYGKDGVFIKYYDKNGKIWFSFGSQVGSDFEIFKLVPNNDGTIDFGAKFNCTLYSLSGDSTVLNNGYMYSVFENDLF